MAFLRRSGPEAGGGAADGSLAERWRTTVPGEADNRVLCDPLSSSVFVSDGWSIPYAALRVHRLDIATGAHHAAARTRHQGVTAMIVWGDSLFVATDSRFTSLDRNTLKTLRSWDKRVVALAHQLVPVGDTLVAANWLRPSIGLFDPATGITQRLKVGGQPLVFTFSDRVHVISGYDGGMSVLDIDRRRLVETRPTPPIFTISVGRDVWGVKAGPPTGGQGQPPVWTRQGTETITRLIGGDCEYDVGGPCDQIAVDDLRGLVWCVTDRRHRLQAVMANRGETVATFDPGLAGPEQSFCHVDPRAGLAFALGEPQRIVENGVIQSCSSTLVCYELPPPDAFAPTAAQHGA